MKCERSSEERHPMRALVTTTSANMDRKSLHDNKHQQRLYISCLFKTLGLWRHQKLCLMTIQTEIQEGDAPDATKKAVKRGIRNVGNFEPFLPESCFKRYSEYLRRIFTDCFDPQVSRYFDWSPKPPAVLPGISSIWSACPSPPWQRRRSPSWCRSKSERPRFLKPRWVQTVSFYKSWKCVKNPYNFRVVWRYVRQSSMAYSKRFPLWFELGLCFKDFSQPSFGFVHHILVRPTFAGPRIADLEEEKAFRSLVGGIRKPESFLKYLRCSWPTVCRRPCGFIHVYINFGFLGGFGWFWGGGWDNNKRVSFSAT